MKFYQCILCNRKYKTIKGLDNHIYTIKHMMVRLNWMKKEIEK